LKPAPSLQPLTIPAFSLPETVILSNGTRIFGFNGAFNDILRLEFVFDSGRWTEEHPLTAHASSKLFKGGTNTRTAFQIDEAIDSLGATITATAGYHGYVISVYTMRKHLKKVLTLLQECLFNSTFPESEFEIYQRNAIAKHKINEEKTDYLADMEFKQQIFGADHPYGYPTTVSLLEQLQIGWIRAYFNSQVRDKQPDVYVSGKYDDTDLAIISDSLAGRSYPPAGPDTIHTVTVMPAAKTYIKKPGAVQASLVLGKRHINKLHPDYPGFVLMNTVFGGYFGSRLMANIREDKGYTYGIYSSLQTYRHDAALLIQTEISNEHIDACITEIKKECEILQNERIGEEELRQARNYLAGKYLSRMDGPFAQMETFKNYMIEGVDIQYFDKFADIIRQSTAEDIRVMAGKYLSFDSFSEVIAGG